MFWPENIFANFLKLFRKLRLPLTVWACSRIALIVVVYIGLVLIPIADDQGLWRNFEHNLFLDGFARWDSGWYFDIAEKGFTNIPNAQGQRDTAFLPAFPFLLSFASAFGREGMHIWGLALSNIAFAAGLCFLYEIAKEYTSQKIAIFSVCLAAFGPFSIFFSSVYTESLYFASTTASFYFCSRSNLLVSMFSASLSAVTRVVGVLTVPFAIFFYLDVPAVSNLGDRLFAILKKCHRQFSYVFFGVVVGFSLFAAHMAYLEFKFGNPLQFIISQNADGWSKSAGFNNLFHAWMPMLHISAFLSGKYYILGVINSSALFLCLGLMIYGIIKKILPLPISIWAFCVLLVSMSLWFSGGRFSASVFPVYIVAAFLFRRIPMSVVVGCSAMLMALFSLVFTHWFWLA